MKKIALVAPGKPLDWFAISEPLQLGSLAAFLKKRGVSVTIIDQTAGDDVEAELARYAPDYVGVTATTPLINRAYKILAYCKAQGYTTIIGGVHASMMPDEAKQHADYVVVGEGENALYSIIAEQPPHGIIKSPYIADLDDIPYPDRSLINMEFYIRHSMKEPIHGYYFLPRKKRTASLITSRGCPYDCAHCHNSWKGLPVRYQSAERVLEEITELKNTYNIDMLMFHDDDLFVHKRRMLDICSRMEKAKLDLLWAGNACVSSVNKEVLQAAYRAGCRHICYGIESGTQKVLDALNKKTTVEQAREAIRLTHEAGIKITAPFMIGSPGETREDIKMTRKFILSNPIDMMCLSIATPYPGTALWNLCKEQKRIPGSFTWDNFRYGSGGVSASEYFTHKQLVKMRRRILLEMFFRLNIDFTLYYLKYPSYVITRFVETLRSALGLKYKS